MILLIDGYNLIKIVFSANKITENFRNEFINKLSYYAKKKDHKVIIFFDGGENSFSTKEIVKEITVVYSGYQETADDIIKEYILKNKDKDLLVVTSDRALQKFAESLKISFISSQEFYKKLNTKDEHSFLNITKDNFIYKTSSTQIPELDLLMTELEDIVIKKENDIISNKKQTTNKFSKKEKKIIRKLRKL